METQFDGTTVKEDHLPTIDGFSSTGFEYPKPTANADGVSLATVPRVAQGVVALMLFFGTSSPGSQAIDLRKFQNLKIAFPSASQVETTSASERYAALKQEIVAAGVPLLNDEELRQEIRTRKGLRPEPE